MSIEEARKILELTGSVAPDDIRRAFRRMAMRYHPDRYQTFSQQAWATRRFIKIKEAYDFLMTSTDAESFQKEETFHSATTTNDLYTGNENSSASDFSLFDWIFNKLSKFSDRNRLIIFIIVPLLMPLFVVFIYYGFFVFVLQNILEECGLDPFPDSRSKQGRFAFLVISTVVALSYLPIFYWMCFTRSGQTSVTTPRIVLGLASSAIVILFVLSEWISFLLTSSWRHSTQRALERVPMQKQR